MNASSILLLEATGLKKSFSGVMALKDASFRLMSGSVHALCGGNGAESQLFYLLSWVLLVVTKVN